MPNNIHSDKYKAFLLRLRQARKEMELTQAQVAMRLGKPQSYVAKCESGERRVDVVDISEFAKLYGKPLNYFLR